MNRISFNRPVQSDKGLLYIKDAINMGHISGDGFFSKKCSEWIEKKINCKKALLTQSCTAALEMAAMLLDIKEGDEVIMPSYTFVSTANAYVLMGARPVFVDICKDTMNIDEKCIEKAITSRTKAIVVVHYAGVGCNMDEIMRISNSYNIPVIEDAAQALLATYSDKYLGTFGAIGCFSFHETKNFTMGEGGAIILNDDRLIEKAEIVREKGTNRISFNRGTIDKYYWVDKGSSYLPSDINAAYLYAQLEMSDDILSDRKRTWQKYHDGLLELVKDEKIEIAKIPPNCDHNGHIFFLKCKNEQQRTDFIKFMDENGIKCVFHYVPLHSSPAGRKYGVFYGEDVNTTKESLKLVRLPLYYGMSDDDTKRVVESTISFFENN